MATTAPHHRARYRFFTWLEPGIVAGITVVVISMAFAAILSGFYTLASLKAPSVIEIELKP